MDFCNYNDEDIIGLDKQNIDAEKIIVDNDNLEIDIDKDHSKTILMCGICGTTFKTQSRYTHHMKKHRRGPKNKTLGKYQLKKKQKQISPNTLKENKSHFKILAQFNNLFFKKLNVLMWSWVCLELRLWKRFGLS